MSDRLRKEFEALYERADIGALAIWAVVNVPDLLDSASQRAADFSASVSRNMATHERRVDIPDQPMTAESGTIEALPSDVRLVQLEEWRLMQTLWWTRGGDGDWTDHASHEDAVAELAAGYARAAYRAHQKEPAS